MNRLRAALPLAVVLMAAAARLPAQSPQPLRPVDVQLDWKANAQFAGLLVAQERGWYSEAGLDVTIRANDFKRSYLDVVAGSDHTIGTSESRSLVAARGRGLPVRAVATIFQSSPIVLISKSATGIRTVRDLEHRTIGIHRPEDVGMLDVMFAHAGIAQPDYQWKKVGFDLREFLAGEVDAVQGYSVSEVVQLRQRGMEVNALALAENGWVDYAQVLFTSEEFLKNDPDTVRSFLAVTFRGWRAVAEDIPGTARMLDEKYVPGLGVDFEEGSLEQIVPLLRAESPNMGTMRRETWEAIFRLFQTYHLAQTPASVDDLVDFRTMSER